MAGSGLCWSLRSDVGVRQAGERAAAACPSRRATLFGAVVLACGCAGDPDEAPAGARAASPTVRDSAGIEIVSESIDPTRSFELVEELRIGSIDGPAHERFFRIGGMAETSDGDLLVLDSGNHEIRAFAGDGSFLRSWGREGEGPGEFRRPLSMVGVRDTVVVLDDDRLHVFEPSGRHLSTARLRGDGPFQPMFLGTADDGWRLMAAGPLPEGAPRGANWILMRLDPGRGTTGDTIYASPAGRSHQVPGTSFTARPPFAPRDLVVIGGAGRIHVTEEARYEIEVYAPDGRLERIVRPEWDRRFITDEMLERWAAWQEERMCAPEPGSPRCEEYVSRAIPFALDLPRPDFVPP